MKAGEFGEILDEVIMEHGPDLDVVFINDRAGEPALSIQELEVAAVRIDGRMALALIAASLENTAKVLQ